MLSIIAVANKRMCLLNGYYCRIQKKKPEIGPVEPKGAEGASQLGGGQIMPTTFVLAISTNFQTSQHLSIISVTACPHSQIFRPSAGSEKESKCCQRYPIESFLSKLHQVNLVRNLQMVWRIGKKLGTSNFG